MDSSVQRHYDSNARQYCGEWEHVVLERELETFTSKLLSGAVILDAGCGPGRDAAWMTRAGFRVIALDAAPGMLEQAQQRGLTELVCGDLARLPVGDHCIDGIWSCGSFHYTAKQETPALLAEWRRVLREGWLFLTVKRGETPLEFSSAHGTFVQHRYHPAEIQLLLERNEFKVLDYWESPSARRPDTIWISLLCRAMVVTPKSAANAVVFDDDRRILLTRRSDNLLWCLPGGHLDYGETLSQAALRELREETGLIAEIVRLLGVYSAPFPGNFTLNGVRQAVVASFICRITGGKLRLSHETVDIRFFRQDELPLDIVPHHIKRIGDAFSGRTDARFD